MSSLVHIEGLSKSFQSGDRRLQVLDRLEMELEGGKMLAVTGASGCGKSTFLHLLGGMEKPDAGRIVVAGQEVTALDGAALARYRNRDVGFIFQFHHLLPEFSALENVMFPLLLRGETFAAARKAAEAHLEEVGLESRGHHRPGRLSGGERQRVAVARALVGRPTLLLADEPTGDLDEKTSSGVHTLLRQMHARHGLTSIIVTHDSRLASLCDRHLRMIDGRLTP